METLFDYSMVGDDARRAVEGGLSEAQWYRAPISRQRMKQLMQRRDGPAIRDTIIWIGAMVVLAGLAVYLWFSVWSLLLLLAYGVLYGSASDSRWHECGHGTAFKTRWMNDVVYNVASFMIVREPTVWRWSHTRHHTDTIIVGRDPEILAMRPPALGKIAINVVGLIDVPLAFVSMFRHAGGRITEEEVTFIPESEHHKVFSTARVWLVIYAATIAACIGFRSILPALLVGLPRLYGGWHMAMTALTQHGALADNVTDHRLNTRTVYMNPISRFIYWDMNYHIEHHIYPMVPYYRLKELHEDIKEYLPAPLPGIAAAYREILPVLFRQRHDPGYYIERPLPPTVGAVRPGPAS